MNEWLQALHLPFASSLSLGTLLNYSKLQWLPLSNRDRKVPTLELLCQPSEKNVPKTSNSTLGKSLFLLPHAPCPKLLLPCPFSFSMFRKENVLLPASLAWDGHLSFVLSLCLTPLAMVRFSPLLNAHFLDTGQRIFFLPYAVTSFLQCAHTRDTHTFLSELSYC